jgi:lipid A 4'-phosphatase
MRGTAIYAAVVALALALFLLLPQVDLLASGLFYVPGRGFVLTGWPPVAFLHRAVPWIAWGIVLVVAGAAAWLFLIGRLLWRLDRRALLFVAFSTALGPGLLANTVLKDHWGRARPVQIEAFGGSRHFTPAPLPAAECARNCSFVSGHAALGFSLVAFAFLLPPGRARRRSVVAALAFGALVGFARIAQGGHFLSDVVYAGLLVYGTTAVLYWWIVDQDGFASPALRRLYDEIKRESSVAGIFARRSWMSPSVRIAAAVSASTILIVISIELVDRPLALFLHARDPDLHALFDLTGRLGEAWGWLILFGLAFAGLHWGGELPRLRRLGPSMQAASAVPAFLFASVAAAGLAVDVLKIGFGRLRPKLLFSADLYGFTWLGWRPDHWSFPSGHSATIVALMTALWWVWPRHLLFYILAAAIVAGSRIVAGAHYPSDVIAGALIAVLSTRYVAAVFAGWGIDPAAAGHGRIVTAEMPPWPCRRLGAIRARRDRRAAGEEAGRLRRQRGV